MLMLGECVVCMVSCLGELGGGSVVWAGEGMDTI